MEEKRQIAIILVLDLESFDKQKKEFKPQINKLIDNTLKENIEYFSIKYSCKYQGDGYFIEISEPNLVHFIDFIQRLKEGLEVLQSKFNQNYRIGADIGVVSKQFNQLTENLEHFDECGVIAARLEESGKALNPRPKPTILISERLYLLFQDDYADYFEKVENLKSKDRELTAYLFKADYERYIDQTKILKDYLFGVKIPYSGKFKILVVDDDKINIEVVEETIYDEMAEFLEEDQIKILSEYNGDTGFETYCKELPDIVVADLMMRFSGYEMISQIKQFDPDANIIVLSALGQLSDIEKGYQYDILYYLTKPFNNYSKSSHHPFRGPSDYNNNDILISIMSLVLLKKTTTVSSWLHNLVELNNSCLIEIRYYLQSLSIRFTSNDIYLGRFIKHNAMNLIESLFTNSVNKPTKKDFEKILLQIKKLMSLSMVFDNIVEDIDDFINDTISTHCFKNETLKINYTNHLREEHVSKYQASLIGIITYELLENAVRASKVFNDEQAKILIDLFFSNSEKKIILKVKNTGKPIDDNNQRRIFEKGFSTTDSTGLGLYLSNGLVSQNHGTIEYNYTDNSNVFIVQIPI